MRRAALFAVACLAIAACGSGTASRDGGGGASGSGAGGAGGTGGAGGSGAGGAGGTGGGGGAIGDPVCASAVATRPCTAEGKFCGGESCTSVCQFCNILHCTSGVWQPMEVAPAPCFACNSSPQCQTSVQYCESTIIDVPNPPPMNQCVMIPAGCQATPTCACLVSLGVTEASKCQEAGAGELFVLVTRP